jgi:hypothetical protein
MMVVDVKQIVNLNNNLSAVELNEGKENRR